MDQGDGRSDGTQVNQLPRVLVIAGTDSSGGAGLTRDVQVISAFGARASCAVTAVTAQTNSRVDATCMLSPEVVRRQISAALRADSVNAIKIGMLGNAAIVRAVLEELPERTQIPIVVDPVLSSSSGTPLLDADGVILLCEQLLPRTTLVTPNLIEAATLLNRRVASSAAEQAERAEALLQFGSEYVLVKGGHGSDSEAVDVLVARSESPIHLRSKRLNATMRGTGCALSSAIAALLAGGASMESACRQAKEYVYRALQGYHA